MTITSGKPKDLIVTLNTLGLGDLDTLVARVKSVQSQLESCGLNDIAARLQDALEALKQGNTSEYRRLVSQVVSRLGHLRSS